MNKSILENYHKLLIKVSNVQWAITTSIDFSLAQLIQVIILLSTGGKNGGGYQASKYEVLGIHGGVLLIHAILNNASVACLSFFGMFAASWNVIGMYDHFYP